MVAAVLLHAILVAGSTVSLGAAHGNITKRAVLPPPPPFETVDYKLCEGHRMSQLFFASEAEAGYQSTFMFYDLTGAGADWKRETDAQADPGTLISMLGFLDGVRGVNGYASRRGKRVLFSGECAWIDATYSQSNEYEREGHSYEATHAYIRTITSGTSGVLAIVAYESPADVSRKSGYGETLSSAQLPRLQRLSDIAYWTYDSRLRNAAQRLRPPEWILLKGLADRARYREDLGIIPWCLVTHHLELQPWPGITFPIGTPCYYAIMATYPSSEIAEMLISHKARFTGEASLASVTVFAEGDSVSLLWFSGEMDVQKLRQAEEENKDYVTNNLGVVAFPMPWSPAEPWKGTRRRILGVGPASDASE